MSGNERVLFIDDEKHIRQANKQTLELAELEVICEDCAEKGLEMLTRDWPGIVVCDIRLPNMDGLQFLLEVQKIDSDLPVILITGHGDISIAGVLPIIRGPGALCNSSSRRRLRFSRVSVRFSRPRRTVFTNRSAE